MVKQTHRPAALGTSMVNQEQRSETKTALKPGLILSTHCPSVDIQKRPEHTKILRKLENTGRGQGLRWTDIDKRKLKMG